MNHYDEYGQYKVLDVLEGLRLGGQSVGDILGRYRVTAAAGAGLSILQGNAASADGLALTTPIVTRRLVAGTNVAFVGAGDSITISATPGGGGVAMLTDAAVGISIINNSSGELRTFVQGAGVTIVNAPAGQLTVTNTGVLTLTDAVAGISVINSASGQLRSFVQGAGITIVNAPAGQLTVTNTGVLSLSSVGSGVSAVGAALGTIKSFVDGTGITMTASATEVTVATTAVLSLTSGGSATTLVGASTGQIKSLRAGTGMTVAAGAAGEVNITNTGVITLASVGAGTSAVGVSLGTIKSFVNGTGITVTSNATEVTVATTAVLSLTSGGSATTLVGASTGQIKSLRAGTGMTVAAGAAGEVDITNTGVISLTSGGSATTLVGASTGQIKSLRAGAGITVTAGAAGEVDITNTGTLVYTGTAHKVSVVGTVISQPDIVQVGSIDQVTATGDGLLVVGGNTVSGANKSNSLVVGTQGTISGGLFDSILSGDTVNASNRLNASLLVGRNLTYTGTQPSTSVTMCGTNMTMDNSGIAVLGPIAMYGRNFFATGLPQEPRSLTLFEGGVLNSSATFYNGASAGNCYLTNNANLTGVNILSGDVGDIRIGGHTSTATRFIDRCPSCAISPTVDDHLVRLGFLTSFSYVPLCVRLGAGGANVDISSPITITWATSGAAGSINTNSCAVVTSNQNFAVTRDGYYEITTTAVFTNTSLSDRTGTLLLRNGAVSIYEATDRILTGTNRHYTATRKMFITASGSAINVQAAGQTGCELDRSATRGQISIQYIGS